MVVVTANGAHRSEVVICFVHLADFSRRKQILVGGQIVVCIQLQLHISAVFAVVSVKVKVCVAGNICNGIQIADAFVLKENGSIGTDTNFNGGLNGGISNGMPIIFRVAIRPTPSIFKEQETVSLSKMENTTLKINGRHDPAIIHRARAVVDAVTAIAIADALASLHGTSYFGG